MNEQIAKEMADKIFAAVFGCENPFSLEELREKFAFDVKLPQKVKDSRTGEDTWASSINNNRFITMTNMFKQDVWMLPKEDVSSLEEILEIWKKTNYISTERVFDSINVAQSDTIYNSENVWRSTNCGDSKMVLFSDGAFNCEYVMATQRSVGSTFSIRIDDSGNCTNSYNVVGSGKISNSMFIQDCVSLHECILCSHITNRRYCIANMQFEKEEYFAIKEQIIKWILNS